MNYKTKYKIGDMIEVVGNHSFKGRKGIIKKVSYNPDYVEVVFDDKSMRELLTFGNIKLVPKHSLLHRLNELYV